YATYTKALDKAPGTLPLRLAAGRLAASLLRYDEAVEWLAPVRGRDVAEPEVAYYLGLAYEGLGDEPHARAEFEAAYRVPRTRKAAALKLGELDRSARYMRDAGDERANEEVALLEGSASKAGELGSDPERVLHAAGSYMRLGLWQDAIEVLSR